MSSSLTVSPFNELLIDAMVMPLLDFIPLTCAFEMIALSGLATLLESSLR